MKKFIIKINILCTLPFIIFLCLNNLYLKTNYWKSREENSYRFLEVPDNIQICNVGSSHGIAGFDWSLHSMPRGFNFALSGQRYFLDFGILQQFQNNIASGAIILIPVSYFQITRISTEVSFYQAYYKFLHKEYFPGWKQSDNIKYNVLPILSNLFSVKYLIKDISADEISFHSKRINFMSEDELATYAKAKYKDWNTKKGEHGKEGFEHNVSEVSKIIDLCYKNDWIPVLVSTPITTYLNAEYDKNNPAFWDSFYGFSKELQTKYPNLCYFDYSHDPEFVTAYTLFADADHLNKFGAEAFTKRILNDLQKAGILKN